MGGQKQLATADKALQVNLDPSRHVKVGMVQRLFQYSAVRLRS